MIEFQARRGAAYGKLRRKAKGLDFSRMRDALPKDHETHEAAMRLPGFDRFTLDRWPWLA